jgi:hypothetical protein
MARSGTTMLFNLLARNPHFGYPSRMDAFYPHTFRTLHRLGIPRLLSLIPGQSRSLDNVRVTWLSPEEDILALCVLAGTGERMAAAFPRGDYLRLSTEEWRRQMRIYSRRLVQVYRRHLLFKSPEHLVRIPEILGEFPQARFVMIFRNPITQYHSVLGMRSTANRIWGALQWPGPEPQRMWLDVARYHLKQYFQNRTLIPPENLIEVRYEDVAARQTEVLQAIHRHLRIPGHGNDDHGEHAGGILDGGGGGGGGRGRGLCGDLALHSHHRHAQGEVDEEGGYHHHHLHHQ